MYNYKFRDPRIQKLTQVAVTHSWDIYKDLPWNTEVDPTKLSPVGGFSLLENLPQFRSLSSNQQAEVKYKEVVYHLSNLLAGEHKAMILTAQIMESCPQEIPDWSYFVSTILSDERNHSLALSRYLDEKIGVTYEPHPRIQGILEALIKDAQFESKLFIGQVVLEWTAASLLASMMMRSPEPLVGQIVKKILADEGRHLGFSQLCTGQLSPGRNGGLSKHFEDLLFEGIVACVSSLCAIPVWKEFGFSEQTCREYALKEMQEKGVFRFYTEILPKELSKYKLFTERLDHLLKNELTEKVIHDHWTFEPIPTQEKINER